MTSESENISVVVIDHDDAERLEAVLRHSSDGQGQEPAHEIVVVADKGRKESEALLERLKPQYPRLRITFVPDSSRRMSRRKIAVTLGVKAATFDHIVLIDTLSQEFTPYRQFAQTLAHRRLTRRHGGIGFATDANALHFSKQQFMRRDSFEQNIRFLCDCYEPDDRPWRQKVGTRVRYLLAKCHLYRLKEN